MMPTNTDYLTSETEGDLINKYIETNQIDKLYEQTKGKTQNK